MAEVTTFEELALAGLQDIYDSEHQITQALPKMTEAATSPKLKKAFQTHLAQTEQQITRLEKVFELLGEKAKRKPCVATKGLIAEGNEHIKEVAQGPVLDAALIEGSQKIEHYEIASYGTARTYATQLGQTEIAALLDETLKEEEETDQLLTKLAEETINKKAAAVK
ncbi:MAG: ferritin-like domain-containing protein [Proteobacteria bacterium]|nr:MAG: ferritin-like domain-containing protein [Pseudomonadota bacterium]